MSADSNAVPESSFGSEAMAPAAIPGTRPLYWSVRRELWENRSIYIAPLAVAVLILVGSLISAFQLPHNMRAVLALDDAHQRAKIVTPYNMTAVLMILNAFIVGVFYCLDALHGERRDRSILFWKSLPVSDLTTVLSKASIPLVILPVLTLAIIIATQVVMLLLSIAVLSVSGVSTAAIWTQLHLGESALALLYAMAAIALWHAPLYGWLLLVSAWVRRTAFLWALLPLFAICIVEKIAFNTTHFASLLGYRVVGWFMHAFAFPPPGVVPLHPLTQLTPGRFLTTPGLWIGLIFAAAFLAGTVRLRRSRGPI